MKVKLIGIIVCTLLITTVLPTTGTLVKEKQLIFLDRINTLYVGGNSIALDNRKNGWNQTFGGSSYDEGFSVQQTNDGGYIITGATFSFGAGNWDVWLIKTDSNGNEEWNSTFGGTSYDRGSSVQQTNEGGYIIAGCTASFGAGEWDVWLIKTDSSGNEEWNYTFGGSSVDWGYSVQQTNEGGYIVTGYTDSYGAGGSDFWLIKTDSNGNEEWNYTFGGSSHDRGFSVQQTNEGGYIITGYTVSYDSDNTGCDVWLIKTDSNGIKEWHQTFGGTGVPNKVDMGYSVQQTNDGGYIITGDTEIYFVAKSDVWLIKTDSDGNEEWNQAFGGPASDRGRSVQQTNDGGYIITGWASSYGIGDPDVWLIKTDYNGNEEWNYIYRFEEESCDWGYSVQQTNDGGYIIAGATMPDCGWMTTGPTASFNEEGTDVWLIKIIGENQSPDKPTIDGPTNGAVGIEYEYNFHTIDPDEDDVYYYIEWGDGQVEEWIGSYNSDEIATVNHTWTSPDDFEIRAKAKDTNDAESQWSDVYPVTIVENEPPRAPDISGPPSGNAGTSYIYTFTSTDLDGDNVSYYIKWDDGSITDWTTFQASGPPGYSDSHIWDKKGIYTIEAKAKDIYGAKSDWSTLEVTMPKTKPFSFNFNLRKWLFVQFPMLERMLTFIIAI